MGREGGGEMKRITAFNVLLILALLLGGCRSMPATAPAPAASGGPWPTMDWETAAPEMQGVDGSRLEAAIAAARSQDFGLHSLLVVRNGRLISETYFDGYSASRRHVLFSVTKSVAATLVGMAIAQGKIAGVDQPVLGLLPEAEAGNLDERKQAITLEDLLTMTAGLDWQEGNAAYGSLYRSGDWVEQMLGLPMAAAPGKHFNYCSGCSHLLSAIVEQRTEMDTRRFAEQNLFKPLGIQDIEWESDAQGIPIGGWGLELRPRDMAKLGYLYLQEGNWDGQQVVPADWIRQSVQPQVQTHDQPPAYGYQWWVFPERQAYAALGLKGQMIYVAPALDLVVVTTAEAQGHTQIFDLLDTYILPAIGAQ